MVRRTKPELRSIVDKITELGDGTEEEQLEACKKYLCKEFFPTYLIGKNKGSVRCVDASFIPELLPFIVKCVTATDPELQFEGAYFIYEIATTSNKKISAKQNTKLAIDHGAVQELVNLLSSNDPKVLIQSVKCLDAIADYYPQVVMANNALPHLIKHLNSKNEEIFVPAAQCLHSISREKQNIPAILAAEGVDALIKLLKKADDDACIEALSTLVNMTQHEADVRQEIMKCLGHDKFRNLLEHVNGEIRELSKMVFGYNDADERNDEDETITGDDEDDDSAANGEKVSRKRPVPSTSVEPITRSKRSRASLSHTDTEPSVTPSLGDYNDQDFDGPHSSIHSPINPSRDNPNNLAQRHSSVNGAAAATVETSRFNRNNLSSSLPSARGMSSLDGNRNSGYLPVNHPPPHPVTVPPTPTATTSSFSSENPRLSGAFPTSGEIRNNVSTNLASTSDGTRCQPLPVTLTPRSTATTATTSSLSSIHPRVSRAFPTTRRSRTYINRSSHQPHPVTVPPNSTPTTTNASGNILSTDGQIPADNRFSFVSNAATPFNTDQPNNPTLVQHPDNSNDTTNPAAIQGNVNSSSPRHSANDDSNNPSSSLPSDKLDLHEEAKPILIVETTLNPPRPPIELVVPPPQYTTTEYTYPSEKYLRGCWKNIFSPEFEFNRSDFGRHFRKIPFTRIGFGLKPDECLPTNDSTGFECISLLFTFKQENTEMIRQKINRKFISDLNERDEFDYKWISEVSGSPLIAEHLETICRWLKCRIMVYCNEDWETYGDWNPENEEGPLFVLEKKEIKGKFVYQIVLSLKER